MLLSPEQTFVGRDIHVRRGASKSLSYPLTSDFLPRTWSDLETSGRRKWRFWCTGGTRNQSIRLL